MIIEKGIMNTSTKKRYAAFLSYAEPDYPLVKKLSELLDVVANDICKKIVEFVKAYEFK